MKKKLFTTLLTTLLFTSVNYANAGSNNGYTTAANVYSGSSSRTWYGGGVAYTLAQWTKKEEDVPAEADSSVSANPDDPSSSAESDPAQAAEEPTTTGEKAPVAPEASEAPKAPDAPKTQTTSAADAKQESSTATPPPSE